MRVRKRKRLNKFVIYYRIQNFAQIQKKKISNKISNDECFKKNYLSMDYFYQFFRKIQKQRRQIRLKIFQRIFKFYAHYSKKFSIYN